MTKFKLLFSAFGCVLQRILTEFLREEENKFRVMLLNLAWIMDLLGLLICVLQILKFVELSKKTKRYAFD